MSSKSKTNQISCRLLLAAMLGTGIATAGWLPAASAQDNPAPRILRFSDHEPLGGMRTRFLKEVAFPAIERESNGRLKIEDHWNGEIAAAYDALGAVSTKTSTDMATVVPEYTAKELPLHQIFKSFPKGPAGGAQVEFFQNFYEKAPAFETEMENNNIVPLFVGTGYPVAFYSVEPLENLDALAGNKWRSASFWHLDFLKNAGATPVTMHWGPEIYDALKARTLDGLMVNVDSGYMLKVHETAPNVLMSKDLWLGHAYILSMNKTVWDGLPQEDKDAIQRATESAYESLGKVMEEALDAQVAELRSAGANVRILEAGELDKFIAATRYQEVQAAWVKTREAEGTPGVAQAMNTVTTLVSEALQ
jgi:TRAP-type C4-dicarboxylate transport system substrate-binding protein